MINILTFDDFIVEQCEGLNELYGDDHPIVQKFRRQIERRFKEKDAENKAAWLEYDKRSLDDNPTFNYNDMVGLNPLGLRHAASLKVAPSVIDRILYGYIVSGSSNHVNIEWHTSATNITEALPTRWPNNMIKAHRQKP